MAAWEEATPAPSRRAPGRPRREEPGLAGIDTERCSHDSVLRLGRRSGYPCWTEGTLPVVAPLRRVILWGLRASLCEGVGQQLAPLGTALACAVQGPPGSKRGLWWEQTSPGS